MDFEAYFDSLNEITHKEEIKEEKCCDDMNNFIIHAGITSCKVCKNIVSNISDNAEWRYYGSNDTKSSDPTRCGMPTNILLPE